MAKINGNIVTSGMSGQVGQLVYKQYWGRTIVSKVPDMSRVKWSAEQGKGRDLFRLATQWAKCILRDPEVKKQYATKAAPGRNAHNVAVSEYMRMHRENK